MTLNEQRNKLLNDFYERYYYPNMQRGGPLEVEFIVSPHCNLGCKYCYVNKHYKECYPDQMYNEDVVLENTMKVLKAYTKKGLAPNIEIFSGEFFAQKIGYRMMEEFYQYYKNLPVDLRPKQICIPSNFTFLCDDNLTQQIQDLMNRFAELDICFYLSASVEGKYMEENRPLTKTLDIPLTVIRDDAYYDKMFEFTKPSGLGYHPMVSAFNIENWIQNFDWWQENLAKHDICWDSIYLLEVRDGDTWTPEQLLAYQNFVRHIYMFAWNKFQGNKDDFFEWLFYSNNVDKESPEIQAKMEKYKCAYWDGGFNLLSNPFMTNKQGISCNIQNYTGIRCADLMIVPCHRTMYPQFYLGQYEIDDDYNLKIKTYNAELAVTIPMINEKIYPRCGQCPVNHMCISGCLGAQYEQTTDLFTPMPTVCKLMYSKVDILIQCFQETGCWYELLKRVDVQHRQQLLAFEKMRKEAQSNHENINP